MKVKCGTCGNEFELQENTQKVLIAEGNSQRVISICETCDKKIIKILAKRELEKETKHV